jgi:hypothetical protein
MRTLSSEVYLIWRGTQRIGQIDIHYGDTSIQGDLLLEGPLDEAERDQLLRQLDEDVISSYLPSFEQEQFLVNVFVGEEVDSFNYTPGPDEISEN